MSEQDSLLRSVQDGDSDEELIRPTGPCHVQIAEGDLQSLTGSTNTTRVFISGISQSNRSSLTQNNKKDLFDGWVCSVCTFWGYIFCFKKVSRSKRIQVLWMWLSTLSVSIGLGLAVGIFGVHKFTVAPLDMKVIRLKFSTVFCYEMVLQSQARFEAFRFTGNLTIVQDKKLDFKREYTNFIEGGTYRAYKFHFLRGSLLNLVSCSDDYVELYVIQGHQNFTEWKTRRDCDGCYLAKIPVKTNGCFLNYNNFTRWIHKSEDYFLVFMNRKDSTWVTAKFDGKRTYFDMSSATRMCTAKFVCKIPVEFNTDQRVLYRISRKVQNVNEDMFSMCEARLTVYLLIFVLGPAISGVLLTLIIYLGCSDPKPEILLPRCREVNMVVTRRSEDISGQEECEPLMWEAIPGNPPYYDDIDHNETRPPSYEESLKNNSL